MAKQDGILTLRGSIDNITFAKTKDGYVARKKGGVSAGRIATDPAFQRTRENMAEFGRAGRASKLLRTAMNAVILAASDGNTLTRLTRACTEVIKSDLTSERGKRNVIDGEATLLKGFEFKSNAKFAATLYAPVTSSIDREAGILKLMAEPFSPASMLAAPKGATHFKLLSGAAAINFESEVYQAANAETELLPISNQPTEAISLETSVGAASESPIFLTAAILFYQEVNGQQYLLKNGAYNAATIIDVNGL